MQLRRQKMKTKGKAPPKTIRERTSRLLRMAGSMASQELIKRIQKTEIGRPLLNLPQIQLLVRELSHLKGAAMKFGQMLALEARDYFPEEVCVVLDQLQSNANFLNFETIDQILRTELGIQYKDLIDLSPSPIAAASIGQVHSARLIKGDRLAIKVQYPGIRDSIDSDVKVLAVILKTITLIMGKQIELSGLIQEFSEIFIQESDYIQEASYTHAYREHARSAPELVVPEVYTAYSTQKVLTLSFEEGQNFSQWILTPEATPEIREFYGNLILDLYTREFCDWGLVQTDPNLGNFLFRPEERKLVLLDFGATKSYDLSFRRKYSQLIMATLSKKSQKIISLGEEMGLIDPRESTETQEIFKQLLFESMNPIASAEYDFSESEYPEKMRSISRQLVNSLKFSPPPKDLIFLHRKLSGVFYILRGLKVKLSLRHYTDKFETLASSHNQGPSS